MGAPIVTIGGKVVYTTPEAVRFRTGNTLPSPASDAPRDAACRRNRIALASGLVVAGLLILLFVWVVARREQVR